MNSSGKQSQTIVKLYYSEKCNLCVHFLRFLSRVPSLAKTIKCIDVLKRPQLVSPEITHVPTIDDGTAPVKVTNRAFAWLLDKWTEYVKEGVLNEKELLKLQIEIEQLFRQISSVYREKTVPKPDKKALEVSNNAGLTSIGDGGSDLAVIGQNLGTKQVWEKIKDAPLKTPAKTVKGDTYEEKMKQLELERAKMWQSAEKMWADKGEFDLTTKTPLRVRQTISRNEIANKKPVSEMDMRILEQERKSLLQTLGPNQDQMRDPIQRSNEYVGTAINLR